MFYYFIEGTPPPYFLTETPKPLIAFLFYIFSSLPGYLLISLLIACGFYYFLKISEIFDNSFITSFLAFFYSFFLFEDSLQNLFMGYWVWIYIPIIIISLYYFLIKDYLKYGILNLLAGLIRPDSWFFAFIFLLLSLFKKEKKIYFLFLPFLAVAIWFFFDFRAFNNPFYSYIITARYPMITGILPIKPKEYFSVIFKDISNQTGWLFLILSFLATFITIYKKKKDFKDYFILLIIIFAPFIFYFFLSFRGGVLPMRRFFLLSLIFLTLFLFHAFDVFLKKRPLKIILQIFLFLILFFINFQIDKLREIKRNLEDEGEKMIAIEASVPVLKDYLVNIKPKYLIVPFRRKSIFEYYFPNLKENLESFREIVALNKDLKNFRNSLVFYLVNDFAGIEKYFDFLTQFRSYLLEKEKLIFQPLFYHSWYRLYLLKSIE